MQGRVKVAGRVYRFLSLLQLMSVIAKLYNNTKSLRCYGVVEQVGAVAARGIFLVGRSKKRHMALVVWTVLGFLPKQREDFV